VRVVGRLLCALNVNEWLSVLSERLTRHTSAVLVQGPLVARTAGLAVAEDLVCRGRGLGGVVSASAIEPQPLQAAIRTQCRVNAMTAAGQMGMKSGAAACKWGVGAASHSGTDWEGSSYVGRATPAINAAPPQRKHNKFCTRGHAHAKARRCTFSFALPSLPPMHRLLVSLAQCSP
jgi:hypothetical protein